MIREIMMRNVRIAVRESASLPWTIVYDESGAGTGAGTATGADAGAGAGAGTGNGDGAGAGTGTGAGGTPKTYTQEQVNAFMAENKRGLQAQLQKTVTDLTNLQKQHGMSEKQKADLQTRIDELNASMMTKEERARQETERMQNEHRTKLKEVTDDRDNWKGKFTTATITRDIQDHAILADAFSPEQIVAYLSPNTRLADELNAETGEPTGGQVSKVKFSDVDKQGKPITLDLTVPEAIKRMKELPERFGNLFKGTASGGLGGGNTGKGGKPENLEEIAKDPQKYREWRKKQGLGPKGNR